jgi:hypothetical protein
MTIHLSTLSAALPSRHGRFPVGFRLGLGLFGMVLSWKRHSKKDASHAVIVGLLMVATMTAIGCGGGSPGGSQTQPVSYTVTITGTSGWLRSSNNVTGVVK